MLDERDWGGPASPMDACREYALNFGAENPERAWVLTDFDVWMSNPFYQGPAVPHPEDPCEDDVADLDLSHLAVQEEKSVEDGDVPF